MRCEKSRIHSRFRNAPRRNTFSRQINLEERTVPVIILWAVPAIFVLGDVTYLLVK
jgi:hypothetical protein